jgi:voltage-gated potassium channel Kch
MQWSRHILQGILLMGLTVFVHAVGTSILIKALKRYRAFWERHMGLILTTLSLTGVLATLVSLHLLEIGIWAVFYNGLGLFPDFETSAYYSLVTYTTVGYGDVVLPQEWRLIGTTEALIGIMMTAWSTAILIGIVTTVYSKDVMAWKVPPDP